MVRKRSEAEGAKENRLFALLVIDQLTPYPTVHPAGRLSQIIYFQRGPVFTEAV